MQLKAPIDGAQQDRSPDDILIISLCALQAAMCYVHVAALVAEFLHRKSKCLLFGRQEEDDGGVWGCQSLSKDKALSIW